MNNHRVKIGAALMVIIFSCLLAACAQKETFNVGVELWELRFEGETVGKVKLRLTRDQAENGGYLLTGRFGGTVFDHKGGSGRLECSLSAKVRGDDFDGKFLGTAKMATEVGIKGIMTGTFHGSEGHGSYYVTHGEGTSRGSWRMTLILPKAGS